MRKSSLGTRRASQPMRAESDDLRTSASRRTLDARRGSGIPQPKGRRSSSENRNSRSTYLPATMKRSKSQVNIMITPATSNLVTPMRLPPNMNMGSAGSQRVSPFSDGSRSSRKSTYSGMGSANPSRVMKDTRPLTEKSFQQQAIQRITSFLCAQPDALEFAPKGINLRQLTMKLFIDIVNYLMSFLDDSISVNMTNYVIEIPLILKRWGYAGNVNASWLKTVNTPHALPHVLGVLSWLTTLASCVARTDYDQVLQDGLQNDDADDESFPYGNAAVYVDHLVIQYRNWNTGDSASEEKEERRFITDLCNRNGVGDEEMSSLIQTVKNLEIQMNDPKELAEVEAVKAEEMKYRAIMKDYNNTVAYKNQMEEMLNSAETTLEEEKLKFQKAESQCESLQSNILDLKDQLTKQTMSVDERIELEKSCKEISSTIREHEEYIAAVSNQIYSDDLEMVKQREILKKKTQAFNKIIVMESCWLPELQALRDETNPLHQDAKDLLAVIDAEASKLKGDLQRKHEILKAQLTQLKAEFVQVTERKSNLADEVQQWTEKKKHKEQAIDASKTISVEETARMKKNIDSLKSYNEAHINDMSLEKAKEELQKLIEKRDFGKTHIQKLKLNAEKFFKASASITQNFFNTVEKMEASNTRKIKELMQTYKDRLQKIKQESDEAMVL